MDLKNQKITLGQLLDDERSRNVLFKYAPLFFKHPLLLPARKLTLQEILSKARHYVPKSQLELIIKEIERA